MKGLSPKDVARLVNEDVSIIQKEARFVIIIENNQAIIRENSHGKISVIGIIGEGTLEGMCYPMALLCEIGLRRGKPYQRISSKKRDSKGKLILRRRTWFSMTWEQYRVVAPCVFKILQHLADTTSAQWATGNRKNPYMIYGDCERRIEKAIRCVNPVRFSVLPKDTFVVRDVYWAETHLNKAMLRGCEGLKVFISRCIYPWMNKGKKPHRKNFFSLKWPSITRDKVRASKLPTYLVLWVVNKYFSHHPSPQWKKFPHPFCEEILSMVKWDGKTFPLEWEFITPRDGDDPAKRLGDIQVRVIQRPNGYKYFVFGVYEREI